MDANFPNFQTYTIPRTAHCAVCGSEEIMAVCQNCGVALCTAHVNAPVERRHYAFLRRLRQRFLFSEEIPQFHQLVIPQPPQRGGQADPGTLLIERMFDSVFFQWQQFRYHLALNRAWFRLNVLGRANRRVTERDTAAHCPRCLPIARSFYPLITTGFRMTIVFFLVVVLLLTGSEVTGTQPAVTGPVFLALVLGFMMMVMGVVFNQLYYVYQQQLSVPNSLWIECNPQSLHVVERVWGTITLAPAGSTTHVLRSSGSATRVTGQIDAQFLLDENSMLDRDTFQDRARFLHSNRNPHRTRYAFVLLNGVHWHLRHTGHFVQTFGDWLPTNSTPTTFALSIPQAQPGMMDLLTRAEGAARFTTRRDFHYDIPNSLQNTLELPCQVIPTFVRNTDGRVLDIEIEINEPAANLNGARIDELVLDIPLRMGQVIKVEPLCVHNPVGPGHPTANQFVWRDLLFNCASGAQRCRTNVVIHFERPVIDSELLQGRMRLRYPALSFRRMTLRADTSSVRPYRPRLDEHAVMLFDTFGNRRDLEITPSWQTEIYATLQLDLRALRHDTLRARTFTLSQTGAAPNNERVARLIDALNGDRFSIKRVTENPPPIYRQDGQQVQHFWSLYGRAHEGLYPFCFHIVLTGTEVFQNPSASSICAEVHVQSTVASAVMNQTAANFQGELGRLIWAALQ